MKAVSDRPGVPAMNRWRSSNASASGREDVPLALPLVRVSVSEREEKALPLLRVSVSEREEKVSLAGKFLCGMVFG